MRGSEVRGEGVEILLFCAFAFGFSWSIWLAMHAAGITVHPASLPTHFPGLLGPLVAASATSWVLRRKAGRRDLLARLVRLPQGGQGWALALSPAVLVALAILASPHLGAPVDLDAIRRFSGLPVLPLPWLFLIVLLVNGFGEEGGWRGFLLPRLQRRFGAVGGVLTQAAIWLAWHAPLFLILATYRAMPPAMIVFGFGLGLVLGAFVLAQVAARSGGSVLAVALWHSLYNFGTATELGGLVPALVSAAVMSWGGGLLLWALASARGRTAIRVPPPIGSPSTIAPGMPR